MNFEELSQKLEPMYQFLKDKCYGFIVGGSYNLPWIITPDDIDIIVVFKNKELRDELTFDKELNTEFMQLKDELKKDSISIITQFEDKLINMDRAWRYLYLYDKPIKGNISFDYSVDIFSNDYLDILKSNIEFLMTKYTQTQKVEKHLYHILTGLYMRQNHNYELTSEQIKNINIVHDMFDNEKIVELLNWAYSELN